MCDSLLLSLACRRPYIVSDDVVTIASNIPGFGGQGPVHAA